MFTREPDFINGDIVKGVVTKARYSIEGKHPELVIDYHAGSQRFRYTTTTWFLRAHKTGEGVRIIYDPSHPEVAAIYSFIGYWIKWPELLVSAGFFIILFSAAASITGPSGSENVTEKQADKRR